MILRFEENNSSQKPKAILATGGFGDYSNTQTAVSTGLSVQTPSLTEDKFIPTEVEQLKCEPFIWRHSLDNPETYTSGVKVYRPRKYSVDTSPSWGSLQFVESITFIGSVEVQGCGDLVTMDSTKKMMNAKKGYLLHYRCTAAGDTISIWEVSDLC